MRGVWVALLLASTALAGCSEDVGPIETDEQLEGLDDELEATSTTGVIRGVVIDVAVVPVVGANITIAGLGLTTTTNENGAFGFSALEPGTYFLTASKIGFNTTQSSVTVSAGVDKPPIVKIQMIPNPSEVPYAVPTYLVGFLACGFAVIATSIGCTINGVLADLTSSTSIWLHQFDNDNIKWTQGELVWEHNQPLGGYLIWEITARTNTPHGYRETTGSPALAYWDTAKLEENPNDALENGVTYRMFGGPHPLCTGVFFGCGVTLDQAVEAFIHDFYNFTPAEGWRYTNDGDPVPPS